MCILVQLSLFTVQNVYAEDPDLYSDFRFYGSVRPVVQYSKQIEGTTEWDLAQYSSRLGFAAFQEIQNRTGLLFRGELRFEPDKFELEDGDGLIYGGLRGPWGQLSFGRQWSAFYSTVGEHLDKAVGLSGFGYLGSNRISDTLQYSQTFGPTYIQFDAVYSDLFDASSDSESGLNRWQLGLNYEGTTYRAGIAYDVNDESASINVPLDPDQTSICDINGECLGTMVGWRGYNSYVNLGYTEFSSDDPSFEDQESLSISLGWNPNFWRYYIELSSIKDFRNSFSIGTSYQITNQWHLFSEAVFHDNQIDESVKKETAVLNDEVFIIGVRFDFYTN